MHLRADMAKKRKRAKRGRKRSWRSAPGTIPVAIGAAVIGAIVGSALTHVALGDRVRDWAARARSRMPRIGRDERARERAQNGAGRDDGGLGI